MKNYTYLSIILAALTTSFAHSMQQPSLAAYLEQEEADDHSYMRKSICGIEMILHQNTHVQGYCLSYPQVQNFLAKLLQASDKDSYHVSELIMRKHPKEGAVKEEINEKMSLEEAQKKIDQFSASMHDRIKEFQEKSRQNHIREYQKKYGTSENNSNL
jgi:hypothetical protein